MFQDQTFDWAEEASHWSEAAKQSTSLGLDFGEALAAYTIQVCCLTEHTEEKGKVAMLDLFNIPDTPLDSFYKLFQ